MLYATGFFVPDPFIFFRHRGKKYVVMSDLELDRAKKQAEVDHDEQLSAYALATAMGAVLDPQTKVPLPPATKLTLYFTENDLCLSTTRTPEQLDEFRLSVIDKARRIPSGDFTAMPGQWRCGRCDYRLICPSRYGAERSV